MALAGLLAQSSAPAAQAAGGKVDWMTLLVILGGVAAFMLAIHIMGRILAATHPAPPPRANVALPETRMPLSTSGSAQPLAGAPIDNKKLAIIAAAATEALGQPHRILSIAPAQPPSVESLMAQWSMEGRRAIYSSHKFR